MAEFVGRVVSNRMRKSVLVAVDSFHWHSKYKVNVKRTSKLMAHDEANTCNVGDKVKITECRPLSRRKSFVLSEILHRAPVYDAKQAVAEAQAEQSAASANSSVSAAGRAGNSPGFAASGMLDAT